MEIDHPRYTKKDCFAPVVSIEAIRLGFLLAQMHDLKCLAGDVGNAFLMSFTTQKLYIIAGLEFGPEFAGKRLIDVLSAPVPYRHYT
jgi:hypothetical protein